MSTSTQTERTKIEQQARGRLVLSLNSHSLDNFQGCTRKYQFTQIEGLQSKKYFKGMSKGTLWHGLQKVWNEGIELWQNKNTIGSTCWKDYLEKLSPELKKQDYSDYKFNLFKACVDWFNKNCPSEMDSIDRLLILKRFAEYRARYLEIKGNIIAVEKGFTKELYRDAYVIIVYEGKIDLLIKRPEGILVWVDYKTQHPKFTQDLYPYSNQFLGYTWAVGNSHGIVDYTTFSKSITDRTFRAKLETYPYQKIENWKKLTIDWAHRIIKAHITEDFIETFSECDGKYGICTFSTICNTPVTFRERVKKNEFIKGEPYRSW